MPLVRNRFESLSFHTKKILPLYVIIYITQLLRGIRPEDYVPDLNPLSYRRILSDFMLSIIDYERVENGLQFKDREGEKPNVHSIGVEYFTY